MSQQKKQDSKKGKPRSYGKRQARIAGYYEVRYPEKKLRRMANHGASVAELRAWADNYKTPSGVSGARALVKIAREKKLAV